MPTPAEAGLFFSPCLVAAAAERTNTVAANNKSPNSCVEKKKKRLTGGETRRRDDANENIGNGRAAWVKWLALWALLPAGPYIKLP